MIEQKFNNLPFIVGGVVGLYVYFTSPENTVYYSLGMGLMFYYLISFVLHLGVSLPIKELMALICILQWIVAPVWIWNYYNDSPINYMPIDEKPYMDIVFPATLAYLIGLNVFGVKTFAVRNTNAIGKLFENKEHYFELGKKFVIAGFVTSFAFPFLPESLFYFGILMSNLKLVGAMYIMLSNDRLKWYWVVGTLAFNSVGGLTDAVFHDLIIWMGYVFIVFFLVYKFDFRSKTIMFSISLYLLFVLQSVKHDYRQRDFQGPWEGAQVMYELFEDRISHPDKILNKENYENVVARLNQGRIIGFILNHIPANQNYLEGNSITMAFESLVPRFLNPNKKVIAGGFERFALFTGRHLPFGTSMDISLVGEAYGNFGPTGSMVCLFCIGVFFSWILSYFLSFSDKFPSIVLWVPFVFFFIIKAESDFSSVINQMFKSYLILFIILRYFGKVLLTPKQPIRNFSSAIG